MNKEEINKQAQIEYIQFIEKNMDNIIEKIMNKKSTYNFTEEYEIDYWIKLVEKRNRINKLKNLNNVIQNSRKR